MTSTTTLSSGALELLEGTFGHREFLPGQEAVVERVLAGESALAIFPTGGGKSLCYQLPALMLEGTTLVVSPLRALMKDQVDAMREVGVAAARLDGGLLRDEYRAARDAFAAGELDLLYVAPERFRNDRFVELLGSVDIALAAVDEAHCVSEWGHDFRPDYLRLGTHLRRHGIEAVLCLTATATRRVAADVRESFSIPSENVVRRPTHRPNLELRVEVADPDDRLGDLERVLRTPPHGPTVVYATKRKTTEETAEALCERGFEAVPFHAGLDEEVKRERQEWFLGSEDGVVVATIAFGMGVDKPDIRRIVHHNLPRSLEGYLQEVGRAGRDGEPARCTILHEPTDVTVLRNYVDGKTPPAAAFEGLVEEVFADETYHLAPHAVSDRFRIPKTTVRAVFALLEERGLLVAHTPSNRRYRYRLLRDFGEVRDLLPDDLRATLGQLARYATHKTKWSHLALKDVPRFAGLGRADLEPLLDELAGRGLGEVKRAGWYTPHEILRTPDDPAELARELHGVFREREAHQLARIDEMVDILGTAPCLWRALSDHLGDGLEEPCGHCGPCLDGPRAEPLPSPPPLELPPGTRGWVRAALEKDPDLADDPFTIARFLCGVWGPDVRASRLQYVDGYRELARHPVRAVEEGVRDLLEDRGLAARGAGR